MKHEIGYQGVPGAFSEVAARRLLCDLPDMNPFILVPFESFDHVFRSLPELTAAVIPVENSLAGNVIEGVVENFENIRSCEAEIRYEVSMRIVHFLIGCPGATLADVREVHSHPMALLQCQQFLRKHARQFRGVVDYDTAGSVQRVVAEKNKRFAAIASARAAELYGGRILARNVGDTPENYTRFFFIASKSQHKKGGCRPKANKTSIVFGVGNEPGALARCLMLFATRGIDLKRITSRPVGDRAWDYAFYIDIVGNPATDEKVERALKELSAMTEFCDILGSYESIVW